MESVNIFGLGTRTNVGVTTTSTPGSTLPNENSWNIIGNTIGNNNSLLGTLDDYDFNIIRNDINKLTIKATEINVNNNKITSVVDPVNNQDAATKHYVDLNAFDPIDKYPPVYMTSNSTPEPYIITTVTAASD